MSSCLLFGQGTPTDSWPTYNGDYSGRRYSTLSKINPPTINSIGLAWVYRASPGGNLRTTIKSTPLVLNGVMYFTIPDQAWAIDARTGREIWHFTWQSKGGDHIPGEPGSETWPSAEAMAHGGGMTWVPSTYDPANNFVALNATTGAPLWHVNLGSGISNGPITYELDGTQYLVVAAGDTLYGFAMLNR